MCINVVYFSVLFVHATSATQKVWNKHISWNYRVQKLTYGKKHNFIRDENFEGQMNVAAIVREDGFSANQLIGLSAYLYKLVSVNLKNQRCCSLAGCTVQYVVLLLRLQTSLFCYMKSVL